MRNAIILCSGGLDSVTCAYYVRNAVERGISEHPKNPAKKQRGFFDVKNNLRYRKIFILFFNYGQKSLASERRASKKCAKKLNARFREIKLGWLGKISNSMINKKGKINEVKNLKDTKKESDKFYVPCRNTVFIASAMSFAESLGGGDIFLGFKNEGKEPFPDSTAKFVGEMNKLAKISTKSKIKIIAPLIKMDKEDIILLGKNLGIDFKDTHSCYAGNLACGKCLACKLRKSGFYWANIDDETEYI
jgi:7-cyano-7-deazaguanine synthase